MAAIAASLVGYQAWKWQSARGGSDAEKTAVSVRKLGVPEPAANDGELIRLRGDLERVRGQLGQLENAVAKQKLEDQPSEGQPAEDSDLTVQEQRALADQRWKEHMVEVATAFDREPRDPRWSGAATAALQNALARDPALEAVAGKIDCRSSTCRFDLQRNAAVDNQLSVLLMSLHDILPEAEADHVTTDGKSRYTLYLKDSRRSQGRATSVK
ncbi:MAG TPA: hypothetical protein VJN18_15040 [Polyangiaceae bacterium]|nr:hypothetical protein [Polyangiaceae bacterium]